MADKCYTVPENPIYNAEKIRMILDTDPVKASSIINPVVVQLIENIHYVKLDLDAHKAGARRHVVAVRPRDSNKPDYGLGGGGEDGGEETIALEAGPYTGAAEIAAVVNGVLYDANNMSTNGDTAPDGTILIKTEEQENG